MDGSIPGEAYLDTCPISVEDHFSRLLEVVAAGPPPTFQGGGFGVDTHGDMAGYHEAREAGMFTGGRRANFRLFYILWRIPPGLADEVPCRVAARLADTALKGYVDGLEPDRQVRRQGPGPAR